MQIGKNFRFRSVTYKDHKYLRLEDVVEFVEQLGAGEETDVKNKLNEAAHTLINHYDYSNTKKN